MDNNLQANFKQFLPTNYFIESEAINLNSKLVKKIEVGSWLEIDSYTLKSKVVLNKQYYKATIYSKDNYVFCKVSKKDKKYNKIVKYDFYFKIYLDSLLNIKDIALSENPISATLMKKSKAFAKVKLYFKDKIYVEIEGIL